MKPKSFYFLGRKRNGLALLGCLLSIVGCGVSDYETDFKNATEWVNYVDEENKWLGEPAQMPPKKETAPVPKGKQPTPPVEWFLRLPKDISAKPDPDPIGTFLYHYPRLTSGQASPQAAAQSAAQATGVKDVYVAVASTADKKKEEFKSEIIASFTGIDPSIKKTENKQAPRGKPLSLEVYSYAGPEEALFIYFYSEQNFLAGVVYRLDTSKPAKNTMDFSLKTLVVGPAAAQTRAAWKPRVEVPQKR